MIQNLVALLKTCSFSKGSIPVNSSVRLMIGTIIAVVILALLLPAVTGLGGVGPCMGPFKGLASLMADTTSVDIC